MQGRTNEQVCSGEGARVGYCEGDGRLLARLSQILSSGTRAKWRTLPVTSSSQPLAEALHP